METSWREELAWAAGFFDGEGCFRLHTKSGTDGRFYAQVTINQIHPEVLERFQKAVLGIGVVHGPYVPSGTTKSGQPRKEMWVYRCTNFEHAQAVYVMLYPFLGIVKREQGRQVFDKCQRPYIKSDLICKNGHAREGNTNKWGQCLPCRRDADKRRR